MKTTFRDLILLATVVLCLGGRCGTAQDSVAHANPLTSSSQFLPTFSDSRHIRGLSGGAPCEGAADCNNNGVCTQLNGSGVCLCDASHAGQACGHERKSRLTTFLLGFFVGGFGVMRFYLGYVGDGVGKVVLLVAGLALLCMSKCMIVWVVGGVSASLDVADDCPKWLCGAGAIAVILVACVLLLGVGCLAANWVWWLVDWILVLTGDLNDADGYSLEDDF